MVASVVVPIGVSSPVAVPVLTRRQLYVEQIIRDSKVLEEDPHYHVPDTQFYLDRVASFTVALAQLPKEESDGGVPMPSVGSSPA